MIQYKVFMGTLEEIERALNAWAASLPLGTNMNHNPLTRISETTDRWFKEILYVLPARPNGLAVAQRAPRRGRGA